MNQIQATETSKSAKIFCYKYISYTVMGFWFSKVSISKCCKITNYETRVHIWNYTIIERIKAAHVKIKCLELWILFTFFNTNLTQISQIIHNFQRYLHLFREHYFKQHSGLNLPYYHNVKTGHSPKVYSAAPAKCIHSSNA